MHSPRSFFAALPAVALSAWSSSLLAQTPPAKPDTTPVVAHPAQSFTSAARSDAFLAIVTTQFPHWDSDKNGELSTSELDAAIADPTTTGREAAALVALKRATKSKTYKAPPLTQVAITMLTKETPTKDHPNLARLYSSALAKITRAKHSLFESGVPSLNAVHQGRLGDCFCLAPLGAMLNRNPKDVTAMFAPQGTGAYRVTLGAQSVVVAAPTDAELALTASTERDGVWVSLYEKAIGECRNAEKPADKRTESAIDAVGRGGSAGTMLALITGHKIKRFSCRFAKTAALPTDKRDALLSELRERLTLAGKENRLVTCGTQKTTTPGLTPNHAYAILGYDDKADTLRLWNPHGNNFTPKGTEGLENGYRRTNGIFSIPLTEFVTQFSGVAFETMELSDTAVKAADKAAETTNKSGEGSVKTAATSGK